jgi:hypothetical protein
MQLTPVTDTRGSAEHALEALRSTWGDTYQIGAWWYQRRDGIGGRPGFRSPDALNRALAEDFAFCPVRVQAVA